MDARGDRLEKAAGNRAGLSIRRYRQHPGMRFSRQSSTRNTRDDRLDLQLRGLPNRLTRGVIPSHPRSAPTLSRSRSGW